MLYTLLFLFRYFPFWAIPVALVTFELGYYHFNRRARAYFFFFFGTSAVLAVGSIFWILFEGYWRWGPAVKRALELMLS